MPDLELALGDCHHRYPSARRDNGWMEFPLSKCVNSGSLVSGLSWKCHRFSGPRAMVLGLCCLPIEFSCLPQRANTAPIMPEQHTAYFESLTALDAMVYASKQLVCDL